MAGKLEKVLEALKVARASALPHELPLADSLLPYQKSGVEWLVQGLSAGHGCILADEMGLGESYKGTDFRSCKHTLLLRVVATGKTIQSIASLLYLQDHAADPAPALVVTPTSVLPGFAEEVERWSEGKVASLVVSGCTRLRTGFQADQPSPLRALHSMRVMPRRGRACGLQ